MDAVGIIDNDAEPVTGTINNETLNVGIDGIRVGNKPTSNGEFFEGGLAEIRIFDSALSMSDLAEELETVKKRWGIAFLLPHSRNHLRRSGTAEPLAEGLEFHHGSWKFGDGVTITAADGTFNRPMGPFYLNGGGFDGAKYLVKEW